MDLLYSVQLLLPLRQVFWKAFSNEVCPADSQKGFKTLFSAAPCSDQYVRNVIYYLNVQLIVQLALCSLDTENKFQEIRGTGASQHCWFPFIQAHRFLFFLSHCSQGCRTVHLRNNLNLTFGKTSRNRLMHFILYCFLDSCTLILFGSSLVVVCFLRQRWLT